MNNQHFSFLDLHIRLVHIEPIKIVVHQIVSDMSYGTVAEW